MLDIVGKRFWYFLISGIIIVAGLVALGVFGLKPGLEFTSGSELTATFTRPVDTQQVKQALAELGYGPGRATVFRAGDAFVIDLPQLDDAAQDALRSGLTAKLGEFTDQGILLVSPRTALDTVRNAAIAVIVSAIGMLLYISWAFHRMPNPFRWGTTAIIALVHSILIVIGVFAIFGAISSWRIDLMFVTGILTVVGYSVNDTIIVFDRVRENVRRFPGVDFEVLVNQSLVETIGRSMNTALTTMFAVIALLLLVGGTLQNFAVVMLVGIATGTYGSIGIAASLLVVWKNNEWGRFIGRRPQPVGEAKGR
jgi:preprotein translocase subunit SecF